MGGAMNEKEGAMPEDGLEDRMLSRQSPGTREKLKAGRVAVAGLGGLGSNIAVMLARLGVGHLLLVDFDVVEPSNLNRQHYSLKHIGMEKTRAMRAQLRDINPFVEVSTRDVKITAQNAAGVFAGYGIVAEAFDDPAGKAALVESLLAAGDTQVVAASGMAGHESANRILTRRRLANLYLCGDLASEAGEGLMAPRVTVCAGHQANMVLRLLLGFEDA